MLRAPLPDQLLRLTTHPPLPQPKRRFMSGLKQSMLRKSVLTNIECAQETGYKGCPGYDVALGEIKAGRKKSHWIWWVWPSLDSVRTTSRPEFGLPDFETACLYHDERKLVDRLTEITAAAVDHLESGATQKELFGSITDAQKFHETITLFGYVAAIKKDFTLGTAMLNACDSLSISNHDNEEWMHKKTCEALAKDPTVLKFADDKVRFALENGMLDVLVGDLLTSNVPNE